MKRLFLLSLFCLTASCAEDPDLDTLPMDLAADPSAGADIVVALPGRNLFYDVAVAANGDTFAAGQQISTVSNTTEGVVQKRTAAGVLLWEATMDLNPSTIVDEADYLALSNGDTAVYVLGHTSNLITVPPTCPSPPCTSRQDFYVRKLDASTGATLWTLPFGLPDTNADQAYGIAYNPRTDSVLVLGKRIDGVSQVKVHRISSAGVLLWSQPVGTDIQFKTIASADLNFIVAGRAVDVAGPTSNWDLAVSSYDVATGAVNNWNVIDDLGQYGEALWANVESVSGHICVAGRADDKAGVGTAQDGLIHVYSSGGTLLGSAYMDLGISRDEQFNTIAGKSKNGGCVASGWREDASFKLDAYIVEVGPTGTVLNSLTYGAPSSGDNDQIWGSRIPSSGPYNGILFTAAETGGTSQLANGWLKRFTL